MARKSQRTPVGSYTDSHGKHIYTQNPYHPFPAAYGSKWDDLNKKKGRRRTTKYPENCPQCNARVRPPRTQAERYPGTTVMARSDGTCYGCWYKMNSSLGHRRIPTRPKHTAERAAELAEENQQNVLDGYLHWRERRLRRIYAKPLAHISAMRLAWSYYLGAMKISDTKAVSKVSQ